MKIGIVYFDLIVRKKHRFPNLVCEKLFGYWKEKDAEVTLQRPRRAWQMRHGFREHQPKIDAH